MIFIKLFYIEVEENLYNIEKAYLEIENKLLLGSPEVTEKYTKFSFFIDKDNVYSIQVVNKSNFESYWVEPLYFNNEKVDHTSYEINYEDLEEELSYLAEGYDSYG